MRDQPPETTSALDREGIPEMEEPYPGEAATGARQDGLVAPGDGSGTQLDDGGEWSRLVDPDQGWFGDDEGDAVGADTGNDGSALSAEEAAIHITTEDDAPGIAWDASPGYLDNEPG